MTTLHCWHCNAEIDVHDNVCPICATFLTDRQSRRPQYHVVGGDRVAPWLPDESKGVRLWSPVWWGRFIARHFRGELPLDESFWGATIVMTLAVFYLPASIAAAILIATYDSMTYERLVDILTNVLAVSLLALAPIGMWQIIGTWRAANRWKRLSLRPGWAAAAKFALVVYAPVLLLFILGGAYIVSNGQGGDYRF